MVFTLCDIQGSGFPDLFLPSEGLLTLWLELHAELIPDSV